MDPGEDAVVAATRECMEEVGAVLDGELKLVARVDWDWPECWVGDSKKRAERYAEFRGEAVYLLSGKVDHFVKPTSTEGDAWTGKITMPLADCVKLQERTASKVWLSHWVTDDRDTGRR